MGRLLVGSLPDSIRIDDRTLNHLKIVILTKFRRHEGVSFTYEFEAPNSGRRTLWLSPQSVVQFQFDGNSRPTVNKRWLEMLMAAANEVEGLRLLPEPTSDSEPPTTPVATVPVPR